MHMMWIQLQCWFGPSMSNASYPVRLRIWNLILSLSVVLLEVCSKNFVVKELYSGISFELLGIISKIGGFEIHIF